MAILVTCEVCKESLRVRDEYLGKKAWCPACHAPITLTGERVPNHEVFISYSNKDKHVADAICAKLEALPLRCWIAPRDVAAGHSWGSSIIEAIEEAKVMVLVYSGNSNLSPQVIREVERAVSKGLVLVPFRIETTMMSKDMEYFLSSSHWIDALTPPLEQHLVELGELVRTVLFRKEKQAAAAQKPAPSAKPVPTAPASPASLPKSKTKLWLAAAVALVAIVGMAGWWFGSKAHQTTNQKAGATTSSVATDQPSLFTPTPKPVETPAAQPSQPWIQPSPASMAVNSSASIPVAGYRLAWADEFDGSALDTTKWDYDQQWNEGDAKITVNAVTVAGGFLTITTYTMNGKHFTGVISTRGKFERSFGYYEARIKFQDSTGIASRFWINMNSPDSPTDDPATDGVRIDICGHIVIDYSGEDRANHTTQFVRWRGNNQKLNRSGDLGLANGFHLYGVEWTEKGYRFFIDGKLTWAPITPVSKRPEYLILNSVVAPKFAGSIPAGGYGSRETSTTKMVVDYVRFYERADGGVSATQVQPSPSSTPATLPSPKPAAVAPVSAPQPSQPWINSLGMKFVPVPGTAVLFSIWDTRVQDYQAFVTATGRDWKKPDFEQGPTHPAVMVSWDDAKAFCAWLTEKERRADTLNSAQEYRLPTDLEWSAAVGLKNEDGTTPAARSDKIKGVYPWGTQWPPPRGMGNYDPKLKVDDYVNTSPVGSFAANRFGLFDMGGNVWQWCEDFYDGQQLTHHALRGGAWWVYGDNRNSSARLKRNSRYSADSVGFRCVLAKAGTGAANSATSSDK